MSRLPVPPPLFDATPESILADTRRLIEAGKAVQDAITSSVTAQTATFSNVFLPLAQDSNRRLYERQLIEFYASVSPDKDIRNASREAERLFSVFSSETAWRHDLYHVLLALRRNELHLDRESSKLLEQMILNFERNGLGLPGSSRARLLEINQALSQVKQAFRDGCGHRALELLLTSEELEGVDVDLLKATEEDGKDGKIRVILTEHLYHQIMKNAERQETRRLVYLEHAKGFESNVGLLQKAVVLRQEKAELLGEKSFNHYRMAAGMERSPEQVQAFLEDLVERLSPWRDTRLATCRQLKRDDLQGRGEADDGKYYDWDRPYYLARLPVIDNVPDEAQISEYFSLPETINRMLRVFEKVMGLAFVELLEYEREPLSVWHEDVRIFAVWDTTESDDATSSFLGYLYMDMYPPGFCDLPVRPAFTDLDGSRKHTSTALVCNFSKPTDAKPCLLKHHEVVLLFHELGHGIHDLVAKTTYAEHHGASCEDFNEAPSQMLEEWCWQPATLQTLSCHYSTLSPKYKQTWQRESGKSNVAEKLRTEDIEGLIRDKQAKSAGKTLTLANMALFDLAINSPSSASAAKCLDTTALYHSVHQKCFGYDAPPEDIVLPSMQASQSAWVDVGGMYTYLTSQVYASDMFDSAFKADPMSREEGMRYRRTVIGKGSSEDGMVMLTNFLGREPRPGAFYRALGVQPQCE